MKVKFWRDNRLDGEYEVDMADLVEAFYTWAEAEGGLLFPLIRQVGRFLMDRSDGKDTWDPPDTERVYLAIMDDPRHKDEGRWRKQ